MLCIAFLLCLFVPLCTLSLKSGDVSQAEKRTLAAFPHITNGDGKLNKEFFTQGKAWFEDHIGLRAQFVELSSWIKFHVFSQSPSNMVHVGKDGWYFYTGNNNLNIAIGNYPLDEDALQEILYCHLEIRKRLRENGIEYIIALPTSKASIYPEYMRVGSGKITKTPVDMVADYLEANSDLRVIRLKEALLEEKQNRQVYYKTDTHWSQAGGYAAYKQILRKMQEWGFVDEDEKPVEVNFHEGDAMGEFEAMMGLKLKKEKILYSDFKNKDAVCNQGERFDVLKKTVENTDILHKNLSYLYANEKSKNPKVIIWGDSMFEPGRNVTEILAENFSELSYIFASNDVEIKENVIEAIHPDVFIYESGERGISYVYNRQRLFLQEKLADFNAAIGDIKNTDGCVFVCVQNTSNSIWQRSDMVRCGIFLNGQDCGLRAEIPFGIEVKPCESFTFTFSKEQIAGLDLSKCEAIMLQEGITYFGERKKIK